MSSDWKRLRQELAYTAPGLLLPEPKVEADRLTEAFSAAALFEAEGDQAQRTRILRAVLAVAAPRAGVDDDNEARIARVKAHAGLGEKESALTELRAAVDAGYRTLWNIDLIRLERDPTLATLRTDPAFRAVVARVEEDLRRQRDQVLGSRR